MIHRNSTHPANAVWGANSAGALLATRDARARPGHANVEVHSENADAWVVLEAQVDVLGDTEASVALAGEAATRELVLLDLEGTLQNLLCLGTTNSDVAGNLLVTTDTETTQRVLCLGCDGRLTSELLEYLGGTRETITRLSDGDVDDELVNLELLRSGK